jgi:hypothetical protein
MKLTDNYNDASNIVLQNTTVILIYAGNMYKQYIISKSRGLA